MVILHFAQFAFTTTNKEKCRYYYKSFNDILTRQRVNFELHTLTFFTRPVFWKTPYNKLPSIYTQLYCFKHKAFQFNTIIVYYYKNKWHANLKRIEEMVVVIIDFTFWGRKTNCLDFLNLW